MLAFVPSDTKLLPPPSKQLLTQKNSRGIIFGVIATVSRNQLRKKLSEEYFLGSYVNFA